MHLGLRRNSSSKLRTGDLGHLRRKANASFVLVYHALSVSRGGKENNVLVS